MKTLILAVGFLLSTGVATAQHETLVEQKLERLQMLENRVENMADLLETDKAWALSQLAESKAVLIESSQDTLEQLQAVEQAINETCKDIAARVLMAKKAKLMAQITMLDAMIEQYQLENLDTTELEALSDSMKVKVEGL